MNELPFNPQAEMAELAPIEAESIGWLPLGDGAYLHQGSEDGVVEMVGMAETGMKGANVK